MTRTRTNSSVTESYDGNCEVTFPYNGTAPSTSYPGVGDHSESFSKLSEFMYDVDHGFRTLNPCYHDRTITKIGPSGPILCRAKQKINGVWETRVQWTVKSVSSPSSWNPITGLLGSPTTDHKSDDNGTWIIPDYRSHAWEVMRPKIKDELSLLNSIFELKDFKSIPRLWKQTSGSLSRLIDIGRSTKSINASTATLKSLVGTGSGHYLNYMFAIAPLVSDIKALQRALSNSRKSLKALYERAGRTHVSHYEKQITADEIGFEPVSEDEASIIREQSACRTRVLKELDEAVYHATLRYRFALPVEMSRLAATLGRLDSLGINLNPAIIWNAIPFSFVADWFLSIGSSLDKLKVEALPVRVDVLGFVHSLRYRVAHRVYVYPYEWQNEPAYATQNPDWVFERGMNRVLVGSRERTVYIRQPTSIPMVETPKWSDFSTTEKWLTSALLGSVWASRR